MFALLLNTKLLCELGGVEAIERNQFCSAKLPNILIFTILLNGVPLGYHMIADSDEVVTYEILISLAVTIFYFNKD